MLSISVALYGSGGVDPNQHSLKQMARVCSWKPTRKERDMTNIKMTTAMVFGAGLLLGAQSAQAHCDSVNGPVAKGSGMPSKLETQSSAGLCTGIRRDGNPHGLREVEQGAHARHRCLQLQTRLSWKRSEEHAVATGDLTRLDAVLVKMVEHAFRGRPRGAEGTSRAEDRGRSAPYTGNGSAPNWDS